MYREQDSMTHTCQMNNVVTDKVNPRKYCRAFQFHFINKYQNIVLNPTSKRKQCMITYMNTATLTTCYFWRENTIRKHDQRCSADRGLFNIVKYIIFCIIYSIQIRNHIISWCKSSHSNFQMKTNACCFLHVLVQRQLI